MDCKLNVERNFDDEQLNCGQFFSTDYKIVLMTLWYSLVLHMNFTHDYISMIEFPANKLQHHRIAFLTTSSGRPFLRRPSTISLT